MESYKEYLNDNANQKFTFELTTSQMTMNIINKLKNTNTAGHDGISNKLIKCVKHEICDVITLIINQAITTGIFPDSLKIARVKPLFKKGDSHLTSNYRPISILSSLSKLFERTLFDQLSTFLETTNQVNNHQYGYRKKHSTEWAAMELIDRITTDIDKNRIPINIYIDLTKAFDSISHDILFHKLAHYGIQDNSLNLMVSYLTNRYQFVDIMVNFRNEIKFL